MLTHERQDIVRDLVALGQERGFVTLDQVLEHTPADLDAEDLGSLLQEIESQGIEVEGNEVAASPDAKPRVARRSAK